MKILITMLVAIGLILGCGKKENETGSPSTQSPTKGCPSGHFSGLDSARSITIGSDGLVDYNNYGCHSTGYVTCTGGTNFIFDVEAISDFQDTSACHAVGVWSCKYSVGSSVFSIYCPEVKTGNKFSPAKSFTIYE